MSEITPQDADFALIGRIVSSGSRLELSLIQMHAGLAKCSLKVSYATLLPVQNTKTKTIILANLAFDMLVHIDAPTQQQSEAYAEIKKILDRYNGFSTRRNKVVHSSWGMTSENPDRLARIYIPPQWETLEEMLHPRNDGPKHQSSQDKNIFDRKALEDIAVEGSQLWRDLHALNMRLFPELYSG